MGFTVYQMDVKSAFLYGTIAHPNKVYKVIKALYGLHQAPRAWYETLSSFVMENGFMREFEEMYAQKILMSTMGQLTFFLGLQVKQLPKGIFISQDKYVVDILKKFDFLSIRTATTPIESNKPLVKDKDFVDKDFVDVDVHVYRDSPFELEAFSDSDYGGASLDRKSTTEYVAAAHCCGQILWIQNQMMDYGFNFMNTKIHIDNESTISVIKNHVAHSRTKHIEIRFHFIRDCYEKKLIEFIKIHTDSNVADLLTKGFDVIRFNFLVETDVLSTTEEGLQIISTTIDGHEKLITEYSLRRHLKLDDAEGISSLSNEEIFEHLAHIGYVTNYESLTFFKGHFSPQWKFFIHTILHCLSSKKTAWDQFSSNLATALICLAISRKFNFSKFIFEAMVKNLDNPHKFLLYPRFIQLLFNKQQRLLLLHTRTYLTPTLTSKLFSNMRRASKGYSRVVTPLFENMLVQAHDEEQHQSPSRITSSPSLSPQPTLPSPSPELIQPTHEARETASMPHDSPLHVVHSHGSVEGSVQQHDLTVLVTQLNDRIDGLEKDLLQTKKTYSTALTKLVLRVKKLESKLKSGKARRKVKIVLSDDEEIPEDYSKQGRKISQINEHPTVLLVQDEGIYWIPQEEEVHEKPSDETKVLVQEVTPTKIIEEHRSGEKGEMKISTTNIQVSTASPPKVSIVAPHVYTRRSAKDKRKAIMEEPATPKKVKKRTQVRLGMDEELARKLEEEERIRFNAEQRARALQEEE
ncbi:putative ribonuclease H-like domain-containing protein, partial [Tanacetum coccineum]